MRALTRPKTGYYVAGPRTAPVLKTYQARVGPRRVTVLSPGVELTRPIRPRDFCDTPEKAWVAFEVGQMRRVQ